MRVSSSRVSHTVYFDFWYEIPRNLIFGGWTHFGRRLSSLELMMKAHDSLGNSNFSVNYIIYLYATTMLHRPTMSLCNYFTLFTLLLVYSLQTWYMQASKNIFPDFIANLLQRIFFLSSSDKLLMFNWKTNQEANCNLELCIEQQFEKLKLLQCKQTEVNRN